MRAADPPVNESGLRLNFGDGSRTKGPRPTKARPGRRFRRAESAKSSSSTAPYTPVGATARRSCHQSPSAHRVAGPSSCAIRRYQASGGAHVNMPAQSSGHGTRRAIRPTRPKTATIGAARWRTCGLVPFGLRSVPKSGRYRICLKTFYTVYLPLDSPKNRRSILLVPKGPSFSKTGHDSTARTVLYLRTSVALHFLSIGAGSFFSAGFSSG